MTLAELDKNFITGLEDSQIHLHDTVFRSCSPESLQHTIFCELEIIFVAKGVLLVDDGLACDFCTVLHYEDSGYRVFINVGFL